MKELSDRECVRRVALGHGEHLEPLYRRWRRRVRAQCYAIVGDSQLSSDLCQDVFLRVLRYAKSYRGDAEFGSWLYTMTRRVCLDHLAAQKKSHRALKELQMELPRQTNDNAPALHRLRRAFERLTSEQRELLVLHRFHGWKLREIAEQLDSTEGAIRVRSHRALRALRAEYLRLEEESHE